MNEISAKHNFQEQIAWLYSVGNDVRQTRHPQYDLKYPDEFCEICHTVAVSGWSSGS